MAGSVAPNPLFAIERSFLGAHPIYDEDLKAIEACDHAVKELQLRTMQLSQTTTFSYKMPSEILTCTKEMVRIEVARARAFLALSQLSNPPNISAEVIPLLQSLSALYEDRVNQFHLIGTIILGFLGNEFRALEKAQLLPGETQQELEADRRDQKNLIDHLVKILSAFDEAYELSNRLRSSLIPTEEIGLSDESQINVREYLLQQLPHGKDRREFYLWVMSDQEQAGTTTESARAGRRYLRENPGVVQQLLEEFQLPSD